MTFAAVDWTTWHDVAPFAAFALAAVLGLYFTPRLQRAAERFGIVDKPDGALKQHRTPVAYLGGLAIYLAFLVTLGALLEFEQRVLGLLLASTLVLLLGLIDDLEAQTPTVKFAGQILAVFVLMKSGIRIQITWLEDAPFLAEAVTLLWVVGITNAFNIIDVMDGLAAGTAAVALLGLGAMAWWTGDMPIALLTFALAGATIGFLRFNVQPARIYLGDAGSMLLGFLAAALATQASWAKHGALAVAAPIVLLGIPIFDTALVSFHRLKRGQSPFRGSPDHFAVRLRKNGFQARTVAPCVWAIGAALATAALALTQMDDTASGWLLGTMGVVAIAAGVWVSRYDGAGAKT